jgi:transcriptional regulator with PAS, ATPase and Fis domain
MSMRLHQPHSKDSAAIVGRAPGMQVALHRIAQFARSRIAVLIVGETGTGKELFAHRLHQLSGRRGHLVDVDCGAMPAELVEGLLFGKRRGAYTGAHETLPGLIEEADGGTLFLDELSSLPVSSQRKLLRVLESGHLRRLGDTTKRRVEFRLVSAVQPQVTGQLESGGFRLDLFQRLAGAVVVLPPLAERHDDIPLLARHFASLADATVDGDAYPLLQSRKWPGNVRELRATIERAACLGGNGRITAGHIREAMRAGPGQLFSPPVHRAHRRTHSLSREELASVCRMHGGHAGRIAAALGIGRATLFRRLRRVGLSLRRLG